MGKRASQTVKNLQRAFNDVIRAKSKAFETALLVDRAQHTHNVRMKMVKLTEATYEKCFAALDETEVAAIPGRPVCRGIQMTDSEIEIAKSNKIQAIKAVRERSQKVLGSTNYLGLKECKDLVEATVPASQIAPPAWSGSY